MACFAMRNRSTAAAPGAREGLSEALRPALPPRFDAVGEALASGSGSLDACGVVGSDLARDGVSLEEALDALATTYRMVRGGDPDHADTRALAVGWSEATLGYLHQLSCEDPLTGLASMAHVRGRLTELYRGQLRDAAGPWATHALVVVDVPPARGVARAGGIRVEQALRASRMGELVRTAFSGAETIGRVGPHRVVVIGERDSRLGQRTAVLRRLVAGFDPDGLPVRVWIEGLPDSDDAVSGLLGELSRS